MTIDDKMTTCGVESRSTSKFGIIDAEASNLNSVHILFRYFVHETLDLQTNSYYAVN
jgi:hypothetical protein